MAAAECPEDLLPDRSREASPVSSFEASPVPVESEDGEVQGLPVEEQFVAESVEEEQAPLPPPLAPAPVDPEAEDRFPPMLEALTDECFVTFFNAFLALPVRF